MKYSDLQGKTIAELEKLLAEKRQELGEHKRSLAAGELPNPRVVGNARRDIARIHTGLKATLTERAKGEDA